MKYLASCAYDGSKFYGFQRLKSHKTVQAELERVLTRINKTLVVVKGAGRTDRGVHAYDQKFHFELSIDISLDNLLRVLNDTTDPSIIINSVEIVPDTFHARFDTVSKTYTYVINMGKYDPFINDYVYNYNKILNINNMKKCSKVLLGYHDYETFTSGKRESYNSYIKTIKLRKDKDMLYITFTGKSFFRYMIRNMVGALILAGKDKIDKNDMIKLLNSKKNIFNYETVPASGLYLENVSYK